MYKFLAKYGLAAHLAILAVAPLFLFPFGGESVCLSAVAWLSGIAALWMVMEPSERNGETIRTARSRVIRSTTRDYVFWALLLLVAFTCLRALNRGIDMSYDAEIRQWMILPPFVESFPGSVGTAGVMPFVAALAMLVLFVGCRHALGKSARMFMLLMMSAFSGLAAVIALLAVGASIPLARAAVGSSNVSFSFVGFAFAMHFLAGLVSLYACFTQKWSAGLPLALLSLGGTALGMFVFAPPAIVMTFAVAALILTGYAVFMLFHLHKGNDAYRMLAIIAASLASAVAFAVFLLPESLMTAQLAVLEDGKLFADGFSAVRKLLSDVAVNAWMASPWMGTGVGSFPIDLRFGLSSGDWSLVPRGVADLPNGWLKLLTECGIVGSVIALLPIVMLLGFLSAAFSKSIKAKCVIHPVCALSVLLFSVTALLGCIDGSFLRLDASISLISLFALSLKSFPREFRG